MYPRRNRSAPSPLYRHMEENLDELRRRFATGKRIDWIEFASEMAKLGIQNADGGNPSRECCKQSWRRLNIAKGLVVAKELQPASRTGESSPFASRLNGGSPEDHSFWSAGDLAVPTTRRAFQASVLKK